MVLLWRSDTMSMLTKLVFSTFLLSLVGCTSDYKISPDVEPSEPGVTPPEIEVDPTHYS